MDTLLRTIIGRSVMSAVEESNERLVRSWVDDVLKKGGEKCRRMVVAHPRESARLLR